MKLAAAVATGDDLLKAVDSARLEIEANLDGRAPHLILAFVSSHHRAVWDALPGLLTEAFPSATVVGCSAGGTLACGRELESAPSLALTAGVLPGVRVHSFYAGRDEIPADEREANAFWRERLGIADGSPAHVVLLPEPFSSDPERLMADLDRVLGGGRIVGGLASGGRRRGDNVLFERGQLYREGAIGVVLSGNVEVDTIVAQGCRPIGQPLFVTAADEHLLLGLDGRRPAEVLHELFETLSPHDQELLQYSLFVGFGMREGENRYGHGDFLIRNIVGLDADSGALVVAERLRKGQVIQFHLRDREASAQDLADHLADFRRRGLPPPAGALMFQCLGRGQHLYGEPDHDSRELLRQLGPIPLAGFFCSGEIGPVEGRTFVHGYTSSIALLRPRIAPEGA